MFLHSLPRDRLEVNAGQAARHCLLDLADRRERDDQGGVRRVQVELLRVGRALVELAVAAGQVLVRRDLPAPRQQLRRMRAARERSSFCCLGSGSMPWAARMRRAYASCCCGSMDRL